MKESDDASNHDLGANTSGCCIFSAIVTVFVGLVVLYVTVYFVQRKLYGDFTQNEAADIQLLDPSASQVSGVQAKLEKIKAAAEADDGIRVLFTAEDVNVMIAALEPLKDFRGNTYVERITNRGIEANMSQAIRKLPLSPNQMHLNAKFVLWPELRRRTIAMRVADIVPFEGKIPDGYVESVDTMGLMKLDPESPYIKPYILKISRIYLEEPHLVVETGPLAEDQPKFDPEK